MGQIEYGMASQEVPEDGGSRSGSAGVALRRMLLLVSKENNHSRKRRGKAKMALSVR
jgi:hypothetical protein